MLDSYDDSQSSSPSLSSPTFLSPTTVNKLSQFTVPYLEVKHQSRELQIRTEK